MIRRLFLSLTVGALLTACATPPPQADAVYYLVRHAEKTKDKKNPALTQAGLNRANDLAARITDVPLIKIYSSDYKRTLETAAPVAKIKNLDVVIYDPRELGDFSKSLLAESGHILIVGHSNTTPSLSGLLGGEMGEPITEATEYDRLYVLTRRGNNIQSRIERYGE